MICQVLNGDDDNASGKQLKATYRDLLHFEELIESMETNCGLKEHYCLTALYKYTSKQVQLDEQYMGL